MSTAKFNQWLNSDGTENYKCRAWVNFNGTGTVAISASGNVSSITDNGTGDYTVNFTTAMPDANFGASGFAGDSTANNFYVHGVAYATGSLRVNVKVSGTASDSAITCVSIFR